MNLSQALSSAALVTDASFELPGSSPAGTIGGEPVHGYDMAFWDGRSFSMSLSTIAPSGETPIEYFLGGPIVATPEPKTLLLFLCWIAYYFTRKSAVPL